MATQQQLLEAQDRLREATKKRRRSKGTALSDGYKLRLEQTEQLAKEEVKGLREKLEAESRAARDRRSQVARNLRNRKNQFSVQNAEFIGDVRARRLMAQAQEAKQEQEQEADPKTPIDAVFDPAGNVSTKDLKDNQIIRRPDGTFLKYNTEDGSLTPVEFDVSSDSFKVIQKPEPVRTGVQKLESLIPSQLNAARKFAEENADTELMSEYRRVQAQLDAINGDPTLTQEERDNAIRGLQADARALFDRVSSQTLTQNEQAKEAARQKAMADQQEAERAARVRIQEALAEARSDSSDKRSTRTKEQAEKKQANLANYRSQFDTKVEDAKTQLGDMREQAKEAGLSLQDYASQEGISSQQLTDLQMLAGGGEEQFKNFFGKQLDDDNIKDSYDEQIFDKMIENEEAFAELNILQDLVSAERADVFIKAVAGTKDANGNTIDRETAASIWVQETEETMNGIARLEGEINRRKQEVLELKRRGTIVYTSPDGTPISYEEHQRAQQQARARGVRPVGVQEARIIAAGMAGYEGILPGGINPAQGTNESSVQELVDRANMRLKPEEAEREAERLRGTVRQRRTMTPFPDLPLGMAARELMQDEKLNEMNPVEFGQVAATELPGGAQVVYKKFMEDPSKYMEPEEYTEYVQMDDAQKHRAAMQWMKTNIDRTRRSILMNEEAREQMEKRSREQALRGQQGRDFNRGS